MFKLPFGLRKTHDEARTFTVEYLESLRKDRNLDMGHEEVKAIAHNALLDKLIRGE